MSKYPIELLGTMPDAALAREWGISRQRVRQLRKEHNVPAYREPPYSDEFIEMIKTCPVQQVAEAFGMPYEQVNYARKKLGLPLVKDMTYLTSEQIRILGTMSDKELSKQIGIGREIIRRTRERLGIPCWKKHTRWNPVFQWDDATDALLGTDSDVAIAKYLGCKSFHVYQRRKKLGIPVYRKNKNRK